MSNVIAFVTNIIITPQREKGVRIHKYEIISKRQSTIYRFVLKVIASIIVTMKGVIKPG